ncbi:MAG: UDP-N-acetylmuramate--L-alanine ligase [Prolixibacteraceae bacterium]|nr:UDP-N-acetylmuramate--L-alanine ligase [Prolixibacteraceae bacterium]
MKNLQNIKNVYFLGIGGIGMSALARYFKFTGRNVAGYDRTPTALTEAMQKEGIDVHFEDDIRNIPKNWNPAETLAVFTPALPDDHSELSWFREKPIGLLKRAKVLGLISNEKSGIAVAGTHGKTTVSTMTATILNETAVGCGAFLGGVSKNFGSNLLLPKDDSPWIVAEADEFDRSFLHLQPQLALITSIDADHLDIYGDRDKIVDAFEKFISQIKPGGKLVIKKGVELNKEKTKAEIFTYALKEEADFSTVNLQLDTSVGCYRFDLKTPDGIIANCKMNYPGLVNVENAVGAAALAFLAGVSANTIKAGIEKYAGVQRRFDVRFRSENLIFIDDYAHHPKELEAVISSVQALYPNRKVTGIFQPHLFTRTRDFAAEFAASLDLLDEAVLLPIYPAREEPIKGITSETIFEKMKLQNKHLLSGEETLELLKNTETEVILTMGAGDIDRMAERIIEVLKSKK